MWLSPDFYVEEKLPTPTIGYTINTDGEKQFRVYPHTFIDDKRGTCRVKDLNEFLNLCDRLGCHVDVDMQRMTVFMLIHKVG